MIYLNTYDINLWKTHQDLLDESLKPNQFSEPRQQPSASLNYASKLFNLIGGGRQTLLVRGDVAQKYSLDIEYFGYKFGA